ncbi:hypothetical protein LTR72_004084 [Exophiala xenobiotica]|nr:hypothetical protein LTR72_004084 [Exophiala xenobiotica]KAK5292191.1 hypothetical protein LTR14_005741 [Exophiala xenobiotica]KAK5368809.1 hypothetical protein LTS13_007544 [Exophiala xenobiotica]KAK5395562.1 hypothetical protein LTR79_007277 [Exophiala xenobiotica]KAK5425065.1 hypothetical protein LTR90_000656 [Exophiala xenobiotica]
MAGPFAVPAPPDVGPIGSLIGPPPFIPSFSELQPGPMDSIASLSALPSTLSTMSSSAPSLVVVLMSPTTNSATHGGPTLATSAASTSLVSTPNLTFPVASPQPTTKLLTVTVAATTANETITREVNVTATAANISYVTLPLSSAAAAATSVEDSSTPLPSATDIGDPLYKAASTLKADRITLFVFFSIIMLTAVS